MAAPFSHPSTLVLLFFFFFFVIARNCFSLSCPIDHPPCDSNINISYPFYTRNSSNECRGNYLVECIEFKPSIKLRGFDTYLTVKSIEYHEQIIALEDEQFATDHPNLACSFLYYFTRPIGRVNDPHPPFMDNSIYNCKWGNDCFSNLSRGYNYSVCKDFSFFFLTESEKYLLSPSCQTRREPFFGLWLSFSTSEDKDMSLLSAGYSHDLKLDPDCLNADVCQDSDTTVSGCDGTYLIHCNDSSTPTIQFKDYLQRDIVYPVKNISYSDKIITIQYQQFNTLHPDDSDCSFLYDFAHPIPHFDTPHRPIIDDLDRSISSCNWGKHDFSLLDANYNYSVCKDFCFYYWTESEEDLPQGIPTACRARKAPLFELRLSFGEPANGLSLVSAGFSHYLELHSNCFRKNVCTHNHAKRKTIIAASVGGVAALIAACCAVFCWYKRRKGLHSVVLSNLLTHGTSSKPSSKSDPELGESNKQTHIFSYEELQEATNNFDVSRELGDGGFGTVYKGKLRDGRTVAVKRLYENNYRRLEQFMNEVDILSTLRHENLVTLYGCTSRHSRELLLVYEFVANGTVADHLHGAHASAAPLSWHIRMQIAIETADALAYLHAVEPQVIHRDVKSNNILLDRSFHVKVADFGLSRLFPLDATHVSTAPQGTPGYVDPEYHQCYQLTEKSDVYSFGVVLVELISSKPAVDISRTRQEINLANMAVTKIQKCQLDQLVDPALGYHSDSEVKRMITQVAELAFVCLQSDGDLRPSIKEVLEALRAIESGEVDDEVKSGEETQSVKDASPFSPVSVAEMWQSRSTTPSSSV